jgi:hypothetical protein
VQIADRPEAIRSTKVGTAEADLVIGCDAIVTANKATLASMPKAHVRRPQHARDARPAAFVKRPDWQFPAATAKRRRRAGPEPWALDADTSRRTFSATRSTPIRCCSATLAAGPGAARHARSSAPSS